MDLLPLILGFIGFLCIILAFQVNDRRYILLLFISGALFFSSHYFLLGVFTASALNLIGAVRSGVFYYRTSKRWADHPFWLYFFLVLTVVAGIVTWQEWYSILPVIGMVANTVGFWLKVPTYIRLVSLLAPIAWFVHNFIVGSIPAMMTDTFSFLSIVIGIYRFDIKPRLFKK